MCEHIVFVVPPAPPVCPSSSMIEANREEAEKCLKIGEAALQAGDLAKAERFVSKAQKLFTTDQVRWPAAGRS